MLKPDFLDLDKDGNTKEPMKEAAKDREPMYGGGGMLSDDEDMYKREQFKLGRLATFMRKMQKGSKSKEDLSDDIMERGVTSPQDALKMLEDKEIRMDELKDLLIASGYSKSDVDTFVQKYMEDSVMSDMSKKEKSLFNKKDFEGLNKLSKKEKEIFNDPMTDEEIDEALDKLRDEFADGGNVKEQMSNMLPDEKMEDNYIDFILDEALTDKEEDMLMSKLEQDEDLSMLFDKVIEVASEFAGSGPVEGPGSGVSDSIPARLSDGEFVFTAKAVEEIGAENLMAMMKDAEMKADERQGMANGGEMDEEENVVVRDVDEPVTQNINVTKTTVDSPAKGIEDEDELTKSIRTNMMMRKSPDHVRS